jgi:hypothetical protein
MRKIMMMEKPKKKPNEIIRLSQEMIEEKLINHFKYHIGESNKTTKENIFEAVVGFKPNIMNSFARFYWFERIEKSIRKLRRTDECFVIKKGGNYFVLQSNFEAGYYKNLCNVAIKRMEEAKIRADDWVEQEKWKDIEVQQPKPKPLVLPEIPNEAEDIQKISFRKRIIKLYKGEK